MKKSSQKVKKPEKSATTPIVSGAGKKELWIFALAVAIFGFLLYANTIGHGYVLDDFSVIKENFVTKQGLEGIPTQFKTHARYGYWPGPGELYRPVPMSMFSIEWALAPDGPWLSHLVNVLLYALTGVVTFFLLARMFRGFSILLPLLATLFFVAHPVHTEVVANIKSRDEIMMLLFGLLAMAALFKYINVNGSKWLILSYLSYLVALFSKESAVTFVAVFPLALFFFSKMKPSKIASICSVYLGFALIYVLIRKSVIGAFGNPGDVAVIDNFLVDASNISERLASVFLMLGKYLWVLIFPHPLVSDIGFNQIPLTNWLNWRVLISLVIWVAIGIFGVLQLKKRAFGLSQFYFSSSPFPFHQTC